jgi:hypothetical protein
VSPVRYELGVYIPEDGILRSHLREYFQLVQNQLHFVSIIVSPNSACFEVAEVSLSKQISHEMPKHSYRQLPNTTYYPRL